MFHNDFGCLIELLLASPGKFLLAGDFNIHVDVPGNHEAEIFHDLLNSSNFEQFVSVPTHTAGHTLDLLIYIQYK